MITYQQCPKNTVNRIVATVIVVLSAGCSKPQPPSSQEVICLLRGLEDFQPFASESRTWRIVDSVESDGMLYDGAGGSLIDDDGNIIDEEQHERLCETGCLRISFNVSRRDASAIIVTVTTVRVPYRVGLPGVLVSARGYHIQLRRGERWEIASMEATWTT